YFLAFLTAGFVYLYQHLDTAQTLGSPERRRTVFWTSVAGTVPVLITTLLSYVGATGFYWLGPLATIGWIGTSLYAIATEEFIATRVVVAELGTFFMVLLLFGNIFSGGALTSGFVSKSLIFAAFTTVGIFFIKNIIKSEEQKE